jgi:hypothetical protein
LAVRTAMQWSQAAIFSRRTTAAAFRARTRNVEPGGDLLAAHDRGGLPRQDQERGLEGVLGVVGIAEDASAGAQHHRPVPAHQLGERLLGGLVAPRQESFE